MGNTGSINYEELYKNANSVSQSMATPVCSEVMSVARMYLRMEDLHPSRLKRPEVVKELYVVADVLELDLRPGAEQYELPGSEKIVVLSRLIVLRTLPAPSNSEERQSLSSVCIRTPWLKLSSSTSLVICPLMPQSPALAMPEWSVQAKPSPDAPAVLFLHSQQVLTTTTIAHSLKVVLQAEGAAQYTLSDQRELGITEGITNQTKLERSDLNFTLLAAFEATVLIAELILSYMTNATETVTEATLYLEWLNNQLLHAHNDTTTALDEAVERQLHNLTFQVQCLLNKPLVVAGLIVPRLQYSTYSNLVGTMARIAENYNKEFRQLTLFINQNEILGTYLLQQNKAFAEREKEMEVFHSELQQVKKDDLMRAFVKLERLEVDMRDMSAAMEQAERDMEAGLRRYRNAQVARAVFSVLGAIAQLASAFFTGGATAGQAVAGAANAVNQVTGVVHSLHRVVETLEKLRLVTEFLVAMRDLMNAVSDIHGAAPEIPATPDLPTEAEWAIFENEIEAVAAGMPEDVSEALTWKAKCKNVAALGREMVTLTTVIGQLQYDIKVHDLLQEIARNHSERLEAIQPADLKNYQEIVTELDMRTIRMLLGLLEVLSLQNAALHYQFLLPPSPVTTANTNISMSNVWALLLQHETMVVIRLADLGFATDRKVTYIVRGIPVGLLLDGEDWDFEISVKDTDDFPASWSRVRISYVEMEFVRAGSVDEEVHQPTTDTGKVYILLRGEQIFADRKRGESFKYEAATPMEYQYAYRLDTPGEATESNRPSEEFGSRVFMQMTPFSRWKLRLPSSASENQGLAFPTATVADATTQMAIHFHVSAIRTI